MKQVDQPPYRISVATENKPSLLFRRSSLQTQWQRYKTNGYKKTKEFKPEKCNLNAKKTLMRNKDWILTRWLVSGETTTRHSPVSC